MPDFVKVVLLPIGVVEGRPGEAVDGPVVIQANVRKAQGDCICGAGGGGRDEEVGAEGDGCGNGCLERERGWEGLVGGKNLSLFGSWVSEWGWGGLRLVHDSEHHGSKLGVSQFNSIHHHTSHHSFRARKYLAIYHRVLAIYNDLARGRHNKRRHFRHSQFSLGRRPRGQGSGHACKGDNVENTGTGTVD